MALAGSSNLVDDVETYPKIRPVLLFADRFVVRLRMPSTTMSRFLRTPIKDS